MKIKEQGLINLKWIEDTEKKCEENIHKYESGTDENTYWNNKLEFITELRSVILFAFPLCDKVYDAGVLNGKANEYFDLEEDDYSFDYTFSEDQKGQFLESDIKIF